MYRLSGPVSQPGTKPVRVSFANALESIHHIYNKPATQTATFQTSEGTKICVIVPGDGNCLFR